MFKIFIFLPFVLLFSFSLNAQSYSVPSPGASQMTKYSGASLNESSGRATTSIPLYNFQAGNITIPIGLSYTGNGVKIDQHSNWVGTNWLLQGGGVITRVVNHLPDESAANRLFEEDNAFLMDGDNTLYVDDLIRGVNTTDDLRPDLFSFSFPEGQGTFYLNKNDEPRLMRAGSEMKIELVFPAVVDTEFPTFTIIITTTSGVKYFFGGVNASEYSSTLINTTEEGVNGSVDFTVIPKAVTSFYLFKILHPFGDEVLLEYYDDGDKEYTMFSGDRLEKMRYFHLAELDQDCATDLDPNTDNTVINSIYLGKVYKRKKIKRIFSSNSEYEVNFNSSHLLLENNNSDPYKTPEYDDRVLNSINLYNNFLNKNVKTIKLNYITTLSRIFLEEVAINNEDDPSSTNTCSVYTMEYNYPERLPRRFSKAQDMLGYYNGGIANNNYLPRVFRPEFEGIFNILANRSSDFENTIYGSLTRIKYPSGGYTKFEYEAPKIKALVPHRIDLLAYRNQNSKDPATRTTSTGTIGGMFEEPDIPVYKVPFDQEIVVDVNLEVNSGMVNQSDRVYVELKNAATNAVTTYWRVLSDGQSSYNWSFNFNLEEGEAYFLSLKLTPASPDAYAAPLIARASTTYQLYKQYNAYGIRVKRITEQPEDGSEQIIKHYYYKRAEKALSHEEDEESAIITYDAKTTQSLYVRSGCCPSIFGNDVYSYVSLISNPFAYFFASADNLVTYKYVTVSLGGYFFEEGGVEKEFRVEKSKKPEVISIPYFIEPLEEAGDLTRIDIYNEQLFLGSYSDNNDILNGALLKVTDIKNNLGTLYKIKESQYTYDLEDLDITKGIILASNTKFCVLTAIDWYEFSLANYTLKSYNFNTVSVTTKNYIENLPPVIPPVYPSNEDPVFITTNQTIVYDNVLKGFPKTVTTTNSDGSKNSIKNYFLTTEDLASINGLLIPELEAYNSLIDEHRIGSPIQVESYYTGQDGTSTLMGTQRTIYKEYDNGLVLPEKTMSSKYNFPLEATTRVIKYDSSGLPIEIAPVEGLHTSIIYGYTDKKVIAELIDVSYDQLSPTVVNYIHQLSQNITNTSSMNLLETALDQLRSDYPAGRITTYVYNEKGQVDSMKDERGFKVSYEYDECYRLIKVKDQDGNIISETNYNIITNNN